MLENTVLEKAEPIETLLSFQFSAHKSSMFNYSVHFVSVL